jgi:heme A synthase
VVTQRNNIPAGKQGSYDIWLALISAVLVIGIVVQAYLGTDAMFKANDNVREAHAQIGNFLFLLGVVQLVLGFLSFRKGEVDMTNLVMRVLLALLVTAQIGLGYSTRENGVDSRIYHMTNGVLLIAVCGFVLATDWYRLRRSSVSG